VKKTTWCSRTKTQFLFFVIADHDGRRRGAADGRYKDIEIPMGDLCLGELTSFVGCAV
jgi:hypothetical protein